MIDVYSRLEALREMFYAAHKLGYWQLRPDFSVFYTNYGDADFFYGLLSIGDCLELMQSHFSHSDVPILLDDGLGMAWIADADKSGGRANEYFLLGPILTVEASRAFILRSCEKRHLSFAVTEKMISLYNEIPVISTHRCMDYAVMLHQCLTGQTIAVKDIAFQEKPVVRESITDWFESSYHGSWELEQQIFESVKNGVNFVQQVQVTGDIGRMSNGDPLRQKKNELIAFTVICSRAAILGGVSPDFAYSLSDYYIQLAEACTETRSVEILNTEMAVAFVRRVQQAKENRQYSAVVRATMDDIGAHLAERLLLKEIAARIGYTAYYISAQFQKETGMAIRDYISQRKVEAAKALLKNPARSALDISERLSFSSPSHFSAVFRRVTGMTPSEFREQGQS